MGREAQCRVDFGAQSSEGKALLETREILFRGDFRLKIPFEEIGNISAEDGKLTVAFPQGTAVFHLGKAAGAWAERILHPPSRLDKLGVKAGVKVTLIGTFDAGFRREVRERGAVVSKKGADLSFLAAQSVRDLSALKPAAAPVWVVYPKGATSITEGAVRAAGRAAERVDVKVASFSATHTALKFTRRKST